jgi:hypothetical protein
VKTIGERIDAAIAGLLWKEQITSEEQVESILREHFSEPWLDAPDGPGWWWREIDGISIPLGVTNAISYEALKKTGIKWQRVIGPSE